MDVVRGQAVRLIGILAAGAVAVVLVPIVGSTDPKRWLAIASIGFGVAGFGLLIRAYVIGAQSGAQPNSPAPESQLIMTAYGFAFGIASLALLSAAQADPVGYAVLAAAAVWVILWVPDRMRTTVAEFSVVINRDLPSVFAYLIDERNLVRWFPAYVSVEKTTPGPIGPGTQFLCHVQLNGRSIQGVDEIVDVDVNRRFTSRAVRTSGPVRPNLAIDSFQEVAGGTKVTHRFEGTTTYGNGLIGKALNKSATARSLIAFDGPAYARLKQVLESPAPV